MKAKTRKMPSAFSILFIITAIIAVLTWIVPAGAYNVDKSNNLIPGTYHHIARSSQGLWDIIKAPVIGMLGDEHTSAAMPVSLFIMIIGGFLGVVNATKSLDAGIGSIVHKYRGKEKRLIIVLMILFSLGGTSFGMAEETIAFYPILLPIMYSIGLDSIVAVGTICIGSTMGVLSSTVNPFATGVASHTAGISPGDGIIWRVVLWVILTTVGIIYVYRYAQKIEKDPTKSLVYSQREEDEKSFDPVEVDGINKKQKLVIKLFITTFVIMILGLIPWTDINPDLNFFEKLNKFILKIPVLGNILGEDFPALGTWYFTEITILFLLMALIIGFSFNMTESEIAKHFVNGAKDMVQIALIVALARGIQVVMNDGNMTATILHWGEMYLSKLPPILFSVLTYIFYIPMSFLIYSTSGLASATMGIMSGLADFANVPRDIVVTAFQAGSGTMNLISPANAILLGALGLSHVNYSTWLKFNRNLLIIIFIIVISVLSIATALS